MLAPEGAVWTEKTEAYHVIPWHIYIRVGDIGCLKTEPVKIVPLEGDESYALNVARVPI